MKNTVVVIPRDHATDPRSRCPHCAMEIDGLKARITRLEQEKHILLRQLARYGHESAQQDLALAYAEAGLPGCGNGLAD